MLKMVNNFLQSVYDGIVSVQTHKAEKFLNRRYSDWWPITDEEWEQLNPKNK